MIILITGGSGYLGQFLIERFLEISEVAEVHYSSSSPKSKLSDLIHERYENRLFSHACDFETGEGVEEMIDMTSKREYLEGNRNRNLKLVINCTAISQPKLCEEDEEKARKVNCPTFLVEALKKKYYYKQKHKSDEENANETHQPPPLLVHMSTDQVFCGKYANTHEDDRRIDAFEPINAYGRSKKYAENYLLENYDNKALIILRSSVITGPQPPYRSVDRPLFLDFIAKTCPPNTYTATAEEEEYIKVEDENAAVEFWTDEFRNPVSRIDLTEAIVNCFEIYVKLRRKRKENSFLFEENIEEEGEGEGVIYHAGGPERLSRYDMVNIFCHTMKASKKRAKPAEKKSKVFPANIAVQTPADISMNSERFSKVLRNGVRLKPFKEQVIDSTTVFLSSILANAR